MSLGSRHWILGPMVHLGWRYARKEFKAQNIERTILWLLSKHQTTKRLMLWSCILKALIISVRNLSVISRKTNKEKIVFKPVSCCELILEQTTLFKFQHCQRRGCFFSVNKDTCRRSILPLSREQGQFWAKLWCSEIIPLRWWGMLIHPPTPTLCPSRDPQKSAPFCRWEYWDPDELNARLRSHSQ